MARLLPLLRLLLALAYAGFTVPTPVDAVDSYPRADRVRFQSLTFNETTSEIRRKKSRRRLTKENARLPMTAEDAWQRAPIIVGGSGGSGTRGVVDALTKIGIYMVRFP